MSYFNTLILTAEDCPVACSVVPVERGGRKTVAVIQYELLTQKPYHYTQEDLLFEVYARQNGIPSAVLEADGERLRAEFFAKPKACLRASPLAKSYGFGLHFDAEGRVALCPLESEAYQRFASGEPGGPALVKAMRSSRK